MIFKLTLLVTVLVLGYMYVFRAFWSLKVGREYRARSGEHVFIQSMTKAGFQPIFTDTLGRRYYANGERVDDTGVWNATRLHETV